MLNDSEAELKKMFPFWKIGKSEIYWLWAILPEYGIQQQNLGGLESEDVCNRMVEFIKNGSLSFTINARRFHTCLPDSDFAWVEKDGREPDFLLSRFLKKLEQRGLFSYTQYPQVQQYQQYQPVGQYQQFQAVEHLKKEPLSLKEALRPHPVMQVQQVGSSQSAVQYHQALPPQSVPWIKERLVKTYSSKDNLIVAFNIWNERLDVKKSVLNDLIVLWNEQRLFDKKLAWYSGDRQEKKRCNVAWQWYYDNYQALVEFIPEFAKIDDIFQFLDKSNFTDVDKLYHLELIKKKFKLLQVKANRQGRTQTNMSLSNDTRTQLDELAERRGMTKTELVEYLILDAYTSGG